MSENDSALSMYLSGTSFHSNWRYSIVAGLKDSVGGPGDDWPILRRSIFGRFDFVGPFTEFELPLEEPDRWIERRLDAIGRADIVFAWLGDVADQVDAGIDLGFAKALGKRILVNGPDYGTDGSAFLRFCMPEYGMRAHAAFELTRILPNAKCPGPVDCLYADLSAAGLLCESPVEQMFFDECRVPARDFSQTWSPYSQLPIGRYRADIGFPYCKVAVEIDGHEYHKTKEQRSHDAKKDRALGRYGWKVLRFTGSDVYRDVKGCVDETDAILAETEHEQAYRQAAERKSIGAS